MKGLQIYRRWLWVTLVIVLFFSGYYIYRSIYKMIPDSIMICAGDKLNQPYDFCTVSIDDSKAVSSNNVSNTKTIQAGGNLDKLVFEHTGKYTAEYKLLGFIDLKSVEINVVENQSVIAAGYPVGIYVDTDGVMIIGISSVYGMDKNEYKPAENIVKAGDYVTHVNGDKVTTKEELIGKINEYGADDIILTVIRNREEIKVKVRPVQTGIDEYKLGIWIRDNTQGIGMITFIKDNGNFGALGHGITDIDTGYLMKIKNGSILQTEIVSIVKGNSGEPGELIGVIDYENNTQVGQITKNTSNGIFGKLDMIPKGALEKSEVEVAMKEQIQKGQAVIQSSVDGQLKQYNIEIEEVEINSNDNKGIVFKVTDDELLSKTGGIVQGMSGSPILQNGRIIGAVTHVFVNDPTKGYGIFIEEMLKECQ